jgi:hypothetical protein
VRSLTHRLRGLVVAIAALALTATVVFAARPATAPPAAAQDGLERASEASGKDVPVSAQEDPPAEEESTEDAEAEEEALEDAEEAEGGERPMNHGWYVSEAAKGETPDGYDNHGAYVSEIARGDDGKPEASTDEAKAERAAERAAAKAESAAARAAGKAGRGGG